MAEKQRRWSIPVEGPVEDVRPEETAPQQESEVVQDGTRQREAASSDNMPPPATLSEPGAASPAVNGDGFFPIDDAPRNGTPILAIDPADRDRFVVARWHPTRRYDRTKRHWYGDGFWIDGMTGAKLPFVPAEFRVYDL